MKIRHDFVSNSSSSSFIVIAKNGTDETHKIMLKHADDLFAYMIPTEDACHQFGWDVRLYSSFAEKMNFIGIQLLELKIMAAEGARPRYKKNPVEEFERCYGMLQKVCKEKFDLRVYLNEEVLSALIYKNNDGAYTADPHKDPSATLIKDITYQKALERGLKVMDAAAFALCAENKVPMVRVFGLDDPENLVKVLQGDDMGTFVHP